MIFDRLHPGVADFDCNRPLNQFDRNNQVLAVLNTGEETSQTAQRPGFDTDPIRTGHKGASLKRQAGAGDRPDCGYIRSIEWYGLVADSNNRDHAGGGQQRQAPGRIEPAEQVPGKKRK